MSGEPAITKVKDRLLDWLDGEIGLGVTIGKDRPFNRALQDDELPYVGIRIPRVERRQGYPSFNIVTHEALVMFDITVPSADALSIDEQQAEIEAKIAARLAAMAPTSGTIGELLQICEPSQVGPHEEDLMLSDFGQTTSAWRMQFITPVGDFRTIHGTTGVIVP